MLEALGSLTKRDFGADWAVQVPLLNVPKRYRVSKSQRYERIVTIAGVMEQSTECVRIEKGMDELNEGE